MVRSSLNYNSSQVVYIYTMSIYVLCVTYAWYSKPHYNFMQLSGVLLFFIVMQCKQSGIEFSMCAILLAFRRDQGFEYLGLIFLDSGCSACITAVFSFHLRTRNPVEV